MKDLIISILKGIGLMAIIVAALMSVILAWMSGNIQLGVASTIVGAWGIYNAIVILRK